MTVLTIARVMAVSGTGLYSGILLGDLAGAAQARPLLSPSSFVQLQQIIHANYVYIMPALILVTIFAGLTWLFYARSNVRGAEFWLVVAALGGVVFCGVLTRLVNVPLNDQLMTWSIAFPPPNVHELWMPWEGAHAIRTVVALGAFVVSVIALAVSTPPTVAHEPEALS